MRYETNLQMTLRPDLHAHTTASDGILNPEELVFEAVQKEVNVLAITDHDTLSGLSRAKSAAALHGIQLIPGIEIGCDGEDEVHILAYFVRDDMRELSELTKALLKDRAERALKFLEKLSLLGLKLSMEDLKIPDGTACSRPLIARALVNKGYVSSVKEAFDLYLAVGKPAYVPRLNLQTGDVLRMLREEGAVPVLAHPELIRTQSKKQPDQIKDWKNQGLMGIEAYHPEHGKADRVRWDKIARENGLLVTGGSDFHEFGDSHGLLGSELPHWHTAAEDVCSLLAFSLA